MAHAVKRILALWGGAFLAACAGSDPVAITSTSATGSSAGSSGSSVAAGPVGSGSSVVGSAGVGQGGAAGDIGAPGGAGGTSASATGGATSGAGGDGVAGNGGTAGATGSGGTSVALPDAGVSSDASSVVDARAPTDGGGGRVLPKSVLLLTRSTGGYRHESIEPAAAAIRAALMPLGVTGEITDQLTDFTATGLARFGSIVIPCASGDPVGPAASSTHAAFAAFVRGGGGLVSIHAATAVSYDTSTPYVSIIGGKFIGHPGNIRTDNCYTEGMHASVMQLPAMFSIRDEIYTYTGRRADSQVVVRCDPFGGGDRIPISWYHREGEGRVFNTGLGHGTELWAAGGRLLKDHVVPAILWTLGM